MGATDNHSTFSDMPASGHIELRRRNEAFQKNAIAHRQQSKSAAPERRVSRWMLGLLVACVCGGILLELLFQIIGR